MHLVHYKAERHMEALQVAFGQTNHIDEDCAYDYGGASPDSKRYAFDRNEEVDGNDSSIVNISLNDSEKLMFESAIQRQF